MEPDEEIPADPADQRDERGGNRKRVRENSYIVSVRKKKFFHIPGKIKHISPDGQHFRVKLFPEGQAPLMENFKRTDFQLYTENVQAFEQRDAAVHLPDEDEGFQAHQPHQQHGQNPLHDQFENNITGASNEEMEELGGEE